MKSKFFGYGCLALTLNLSSCATVVSGTKQNIKITSQPPGAHVKINGTESGVTPTTATLARKHSHSIDVSKPGYQPQNRMLHAGMNQWIWGNLLIGGLIGMVIDFSSGGASKLSPDEVHVDLQKQ